MQIFIKDFHTRIMANVDRYDALMRSHRGIYEALVRKDYSMGSMAMNNHFQIVQEELDKM